MDICYLRLQGVSIQEQLEIEEALLRADNRNWCIVNQEATPSIVFGISGQPNDFVDRERHQENPIPLIKRFSGGGTVVIDQSTLFISFIFSKKDLDFGISPKALLEWSLAIYRPMFHPKDFSFTENDYTIGDRKVGGNAHYFAKERWLHHTTFLWDYNPALMALLKIPKKIPEYRMGRDHLSFIDSLKNHYPSKKGLVDRLAVELERSFQVEYIDKDYVDMIRELPHRKSVQQLNWDQ